MALDPKWRTLARTVAEPYGARLVSAVNTARAAGWNEDAIEAELLRFQKMVREEFAGAFTQPMIELIVAELMDSYRKQVGPPTRRVQ